MHSKKPPDTMANAVGTVSDKNLRIKSKQLPMLARAIKNNPSEFFKDTVRQVYLLISILGLSSNSEGSQ